MALVVHRGRYVYDHHRVGKQIKCTYIGTTDQIETKKNIKASAEKPLLKLPGYHQAHIKTDKVEEKEYGKKSFNQLENWINKKLPENELAGHISFPTGKSTVSDRVPDNLKGEVLFHEQTEKDILLKKGNIPTETRKYDKQ